MISPTGAQNPDLYEVTVPIVSQESCQKSYEDEDITERMICAGIPEGGKDSCQVSLFSLKALDTLLSNVFSLGVSQHT